MLALFTEAVRLVFTEQDKLEEITDKGVLVEVLQTHKAGKV